MEPELRHTDECHEGKGDVYIISSYNDHKSVIMGLTLELATPKGVCA
jgi:hypothetical protein